ncbi:endocuticle structural glycoprotein SgAbd-4-like [Epargyreus clarus]|uniref:endocuticle structural glycoprotein SgAbd-4-like n=1 Tax=Epargyreus clarus TaxID=520877 RepID=UPI003C2D5BF5
MRCHRAHTTSASYCIQTFPRYPDISVPVMTNAILFAIAAISLAAPAALHPVDDPIPILRYESEGPNVDGSYKWLYETGNDINAEESGYVRNFGKGEPEEVQVAEGKFSYKAPDGTFISLTYVADDNGFQPQGDHLPTPPPIPPAIQKALDYLKTLPGGAESKIQPQYQPTPYKNRKF